MVSTLAAPDAAARRAQHAELERNATYTPRKPASRWETRMPGSISTLTRPASTSLSQQPFHQRLHPPSLFRPLQPLADLTPRHRPRGRLAPPHTLRSPRTLRRARRPANPLSRTLRKARGLSHSISPRTLRRTRCLSHSISPRTLRKARCLSPSHLPPLRGGRCRRQRGAPPSQWTHTLPA